MLDALKYFVMFGDILMALITYWFMRSVPKSEKSMIIGFDIMIFLFVTSAGLIFR